MNLEIRRNYKDNEDGITRTLENSYTVWVTGNIVELENFEMIFLDDYSIIEESPIIEETGLNQFSYFYTVEKEDIKIFKEFYKITKKRGTKINEK